MSKRDLKWIVWLTFGIIITALATTSTFSRYTTNVSGTGTISVATYEMDVLPVSFTPIFEGPGSEYAMTFNVVNYRDSKRSDVNQSYSIKVETSNNLPFTYELQCTDTGNNGSGINTTKAAIIPNEIINGGILPFSSDTTHTYTLTITWPEVENNLALMNEIDLISIIVDAEQII